MLFQKILPPLAHIVQVPGKNIRSKLVHAFNYWLKAPADKLVEVGDMSEYLHNASLL
jgi:geranylgeranyl diphosphate synthase type 3